MNILVGIELITRKKVRLIAYGAEDPRHIYKICEFINDSPCSLINNFCDFIDEIPNLDCVGVISKETGFTPVETGELGNSDFLEIELDRLLYARTELEWIELEESYSFSGD